MITLNGIGLMQSSKTLIRDSSLSLEAGQHVGIIGRNGCGKTSLFRALGGELALDSGEIKAPADLRLAMMAQETPGVERSAIEFVIDGHQEFRRLEQQLRQAEDRGDDSALAFLHGELEAINGYDIRSRAERLLSGLGFSEDRFKQRVGDFSGGWRVRLNLAAALMAPSDLLLLDEPTNHLDLEATVWLEQWLQRYQGTLLLISHDRAFLDATIDHIISFEQCRLVLYRGNYSAFEKQRTERLARQQAEADKQRRRRAEIEDFVRRFRAKATKARQAQSRLKELQRMGDIAPAHVDSPFRFRFPELQQLPDFLLHTEDLAIGFQQPLVEAIKLGVRRDDRIGLLGFNGSGKSTLLKTLAGQLLPLAGEMSLARKTRVGYYAQHQVDALDRHATPLQLMRVVSAPGQGDEQQFRDHLGGFDFHGEQVEHAVASFSGGEKARIALALLVWQKPNLLLLDEPTNHLDLEMCHALTLALQQFDGALVVVSHDRHLLANTVDRFYAIHDGKFREFDGNLADYESWVRQRDTGERGKTEQSEVSGSQRVDARRRRQLAAANRERLAPLLRQGQQLEREMEQQRQELEQLEARLADPELYAEQSKPVLTELLQRQGELRNAMQAAEQRWFEVQEELERRGSD